MLYATGFPALGTVAIIVTAVVGFGAAWLGGYLQRASDAEVMARQLQINAAAEFMGAVGDFFVASTTSIGSGAETLTPNQRGEVMFRAWVALEARGATIEIIGPGSLGHLSALVIGHASDALLTDDAKVRLDALQKVQESRIEFGKAAKALRPRQKNGRSMPSEPPLPEDRNPL
jgi:hypothetical protein